MDLVVHTNTIKLSAHWQNCITTNTILTLKIRNVICGSSRHSLHLPIWKFISCEGHFAQWTFHRQANFFCLVIATAHEYKLQTCSTLHRQRWLQNTNITVFFNHFNSCTNTMYTFPKHLQFFLIILVLVPIPWILFPKRNTVSFTDTHLCISVNNNLKHC